MATIRKSSKAEQGEATRTALVSSARHLFARKGFAETSTEEIVQRAKVTRGALYYHFRDKEELFESVYESLQAEMADRVVEIAMRAGTAMERLQLGLDAFLDICLEPAVQRIVLLEGPSVLGYEKWLEIDERYALGLIRGVLQEAMDEGQLQRRDPDALSHLLLGALTAAGCAMARTKESQQMRAALGADLRVLVDGLRLSAPAPRRRGS